MSKSSFTLLAALEVRAGHPALETKGHIDELAPGTDLTHLAKQWWDQGARWFHLAAHDQLNGDPAALQASRTALADLAHHLPHGASVELDACISTDEDVAWARKLGVTRIILDLAADRAWLTATFKTLGHRCAVNLPIEHGKVHAPGSSFHGLDAVLAAAELSQAGAPGIHVLLEDREGTRKGPDRKLLTEIAEATEVPLVAAGGIAKLEHLHELLNMAPEGVSGAVIDTALYRDYFSMAEAVAAIVPRFDPYQWGPARPWGMTQGL